MKGFLKRYRFTIIMFILFLLIIMLFPGHSEAVKGSFSNQILTMISIIPPVFILLGLFDVWVPRETIINMLGEQSGIRGALLAFFLGSAAAGPLYGAFPIASVMMKKGASIYNVFIFIGAWSTTKIPMFLFESNALGYRFSVSRLLISIIGIVSISFILIRSTNTKEKQILYERFQTSNS
jgi:uncharacterized membrane protein YraQ (UPF0718 family)